MFILNVVKVSNLCEQKLQASDTYEDLMFSTLRQADITLEGFFTWASAPNMLLQAFT